MKLSQRERTLLMILALIGILFGGYYLILKPQNSKIAELKAQELTIQAQYDEFVLATDPKNPVYKQRTIVETKAKQISSLFFPELRQEKFILLLGEQMEAAGIEADAITFTDVKSGVNVSENKDEKTEVLGPNMLKKLQVTYSGKSVQEPVAKETSDEEKAKDKELLDNVWGETLTLNYKGNIFSFLLFLDALESYSRRIVVDSVAMENNGDGQQKATVQLTYYAIPKLQEEDADFMEWNLTGPYGKVDPFYGNFPTSSTKINGTTISKASIRPDFFIMLNPISSDLTTFIMSKMGDRSRESYIYADTEGMEPVTFELTAKDGKYYYSYKSSGEKYPASGDPIEFVPSGSPLKVQVMSSLRTGASDLSGINLTVVNKTDKPLVLEIYNDDKKSRVQLVKTTGIVSIVKK